MDISSSRTLAIVGVAAAALLGVGFAANALSRPDAPEQAVIGSPISAPENSNPQGDDSQGGEPTPEPTRGDDDHSESPEPEEVTHTPGVIDLRGDGTVDDHGDDDVDDDRGDDDVDDEADDHGGDRDRERSEDPDDDRDDD